VPDDVVKDAAKVLAHLTHQKVDMEDKTGAEVLREVQQNLNNIRNNTLITSEEFGHSRCRTTGQISLQPYWASCKSWIWLLQHRRRICELFNMDIEGPLGAKITNAHLAIRDEVRPLFRFLPVQGCSYRTRGKGTDQGKDKGKNNCKGKDTDKDKHQGSDTDNSAEDTDPEDEVQYKWVMLRYPWQAPVPEEQAPWSCWFGS